MKLLVAQLISVASLGVGTVISGLLPAYFMHRRRQQCPLLLSSLLCFGGGVLLATSFVHILPEVRDNTPKYLQKYVEVIFCGGFFLLYIIDELVHLLYGSAHEVDGSLDYINEELNRRHSSGERTNYGSIAQSERESLLFHRQQPYNPSFYKARSDSDLTIGRAPSQLCHVGHQEPCSNDVVVNLGLLVALSVHALLEGLVVGLAKSPSKVLLLLGAIASHKLVVAFCLGAEFAANPNNGLCKNFARMAIFASGSVIGILVGMAVTDLSSNTATVVIPILQAIAGGTLLYVTVSEVLPRERARWHQQHEHKLAGILQFIFVAVGFAVMTILDKYLEA